MFLAKTIMAETQTQRAHPNREPAPASAPASRQAWPGLPPARAALKRGGIECWRQEVAAQEVLLWCACSYPSWTAGEGQDAGAASLLKTAVAQVRPGRPKVAVCQVCQHELPPGPTAPQEGGNSVSRGVRKLAGKIKRGQLAVSTRSRMYDVRVLPTDWDVSRAIPIGLDYGTVDVDTSNFESDSARSNPSSRSTNRPIKRGVMAASLKAHNETLVRLERAHMLLQRQP